MILPKLEDGFFLEREDLPSLEVTAETGWWYGLLKIRLKNSRNILEWPQTKLRSTVRCASHSEFTRKKPKDRISIEKLKQVIRKYKYKSALLPAQY